MIQIAQPIFDKKEIDAIIKTLQSGIVAQGPRVLEFEKKFARYCGTKYAIATNSGTAALHTALYACGIKEGDGVITTPFTFVATVNTILQQKANPIFCDIDPVTFNIDPTKIEQKITKRTKAILPVDIFGHPYDVGAIKKIAAKHGLVVIEDACQAHGASFQDKKAGAFGDVGCFSFYATKNITTGEGGIITTDKEEYAEKARMFRHHGQSQKNRYQYFDIGYNYRMADITAALGLVQMKKLDTFNRKRISNAKLLSKGLRGIKGIITPKVKDGYHHVFHQYTIRITNEFKISREQLSKCLIEKGFGNAVFYPKALHLYPHIQRITGKTETLPVAEKITQEVLSLPVHPLVSKRDIKNLIRAIRTI